MSKEKIYNELETQMLGYSDIIDVPVVPNNEPLVVLQPTDNLVAYQLRDEMIPITGKEIYVRSTVAKKLSEAALTLASEGMQLQVGYGYRSLSIQTNNFMKQRERLRGTVPDDELDAATHRYVAIPTIAGHPAGAAVDVRMLQDGDPVDCGTPLWNFTKDSYVFSPYIAAEARRNRMLLRTAMIGVGFAPFDGEWWHFSYGDKEWAAYYERKNALYEQVEFSTNTGSKV